MRSTLVGLATAAVVGLSIVTVPSAMGALSAPAARAATATSSVAPGAATPAVASVSAATSAAARDRRHCSYPTNVTTLSLAPARARFSHPVNVTFRGRLQLNTCGLAGQKIVLHSRTTHSVVGSSRTDATGFYAIPVRIKRTQTLYATFAGSGRDDGDRHGGGVRYRPARSNNAVITITHRHDDRTAR